MRTFKSIGETICPICKTAKKGKATLIPICGTQEDNICEAQPVHVDCIDLVYDKQHGLLYQKVGGIT